jgi:hypothetical protein
MKNSFNCVKLTLLVFIGMANLNIAHGQNIKAEILQVKQITLNQYVITKEAFEKWKPDQENVKILDVRIPEEYMYIGHAEMACNIPNFLQTYN